MSPDPPLDFQEKISNPIQSAKKNMQENMSLCLNILGMSKTSDKIPVISSLVQCLSVLFWDSGLFLARVMACSMQLLKVIYFQNDFWMSSFEPKNERKYFCISALASKNKPNQKN